MQDAPKAIWSIPYVSVAFLPNLKHSFIAYRSSQVSSHPACIFEIHQPWQSGFSRVYSNCYSSCWFEAEIIEIGQSSYKMYNNNLLNFQVSTPILNAYTKKVWKLIEFTTYLENALDPTNLLNSKKKNIHQMYMDKIKTFTKNEKELETDISNKNIQPGYKNWILYRKMGKGK